MRTLWWPPAVVVVLGHVGLGALAVVDYVRLDWLASEPYEMSMLTLVAGTSALAVLGAVRAAWPAARGARAIRRRLEATTEARAATDHALAAAVAALGLAGRVDVVSADEAFAVTHGLRRPRILLSTGLLAVLDAPELAAVLAHERHHLQAGDPLRLLRDRLLAGYGWFLPVLRWWTRRAAVRREVAADRAATAQAGVAAVAGALLKLAERPAAAAVIAVNPAGNLPERIAHLEGRPPRRSAAPGWLLGAATLLILAVLGLAVTCSIRLGLDLPLR